MTGKDAIAQSSQEWAIVGFSSGSSNHGLKRREGCCPGWVECDRCGLVAVMMQLHLTTSRVAQVVFERTTERVLD